MRISKDTWISTQGTVIKHDKIEHFIGGVLFGLVFGWVWSVLFWLAWEVKDGFVPWEEYGWWGGDGFSWRDLFASWAGACLTILI